MNWKITLSFVLCATLLTILVGWLTINGVLPIQQNIQFSATEQNFLRVWLGLAIAIGLILPSVAWLVWLKNPPARKILGFYLFVLLVQIVTEQVFSSIVAPSIVVTIGTIYTVFRLWQLWRGQQLIYKTAGNSSNFQLMSSFMWQPAQLLVKSASVVDTAKAGVVTKIINAIALTKIVIIFLINPTVFFNNYFSNNSIIYPFTPSRFCTYIFKSKY